MESFREHGWPRPGVGVLRPAPPPPGKLGGKAQKAACLPSPSLSRASPGSRWLRRASAPWEGKPAKQEELPERASGPGTWPPVPRSRAFSGLQEVTFLPVHREPLCVCIPLCPQTGPPDPPVTAPGEVLMTALPCARRLHAGPRFLPLGPRGGSDSAGAQAWDLGARTLLLLARLKHEPRGPQECEGEGPGTGQAWGSTQGWVCEWPAAVSPCPRPLGPWSTGILKPPGEISPQPPKGAGTRGQGQAERAQCRALGKQNESAGSPCQEWVGRREGPPKAGPTFSVATTHRPSPQRFVLGSSM